MVLGGLLLLVAAMAIAFFHLLLRLPPRKAFAMDFVALMFCSVPYVSVLLRGPLLDGRVSFLQKAAFVTAPLFSGIIVLLGLLIGMPIQAGILAGGVLLAAIILYFLGPRPNS
jgi:hypothetical protein